MHCQVCQGTPAAVTAVALKDGKLTNTPCCKPCASKSGFWCGKHQSQHVIFSDGTSACLHCVREEVKSLGGKTDFAGMIRCALSEERRDEILEVVPYSPGCEEFEQAIAKKIVIAEHRLQISRSQVVVEMVNTGHGHLVPPPILYVPSS